MRVSWESDVGVLSLIQSPPLFPHSVFSVCFSKSDSLGLTNINSHTKVAQLTISSGSSWWGSTEPVKLGLPRSWWIMQTKTIYHLKEHTCTLKPFVQLALSLMYASCACLLDSSSTSSNNNNNNNNNLLSLLNYLFYYFSFSYFSY